jgi:hypothetical protein
MQNIPCNFIKKTLRIANLHFALLARSRLCCYDHAKRIGGISSSAFANRGAQNLSTLYPFRAVMEAAAPAVRDKTIYFVANKHPGHAPAVAMSLAQSAEATALSGRC